MRPSRRWIGGGRFCIGLRIFRIGGGICRRFGRLCTLRGGGVCVCGWWGLCNLRWVESVWLEVTWGDLTWDDLRWINSLMRMNEALYFNIFIDLQLLNNPWKDCQRPSMILEFKWRPLIPSFFFFLFEKISRDAEYKDSRTGLGLLFRYKVYDALSVTSYDSYDRPVLD